jgi:hypothetical protein
MTFTLPTPEPVTQQRRGPSGFTLMTIAFLILVTAVVVREYRDHQARARLEGAGVDLSQYDTEAVEHTFPVRHAGEREGTYVHALGTCSLPDTRGAHGAPAVMLEATQLPPGGALPVTITGAGPTRTDTLHADDNGWAYGDWPATGSATLTITQGSEVAVLRVTLPTECGTLHNR